MFHRHLPLIHVHSYATWLIHTWHDSFTGWYVVVKRAHSLIHVQSHVTWLIHMRHASYIRDKTHLEGGMWFCTVLHSVAVCSSELQCVAVCCRIFSMLRRVAVCCSVLHCVQCAVAVCCSVLQCVAIRDPISPEPYILPCMCDATHSIHMTHASVTWLMNIWHDLFTCDMTICSSRLLRSHHPTRDPPPIDRATQQENPPGGRGFYDQH